jgi:hypothetical protein
MTAGTVELRSGPTPSRRRGHADATRAPTGALSIRGLPSSLKFIGLEADLVGMGKSVIGLCAAFGTFVGGYVPVLWGASSFSLMSLVFGVAGGAAGIWLGLRISEV